MSYAQFGSIQATDYNNLVGTNPNTASGRLNTVWSTGGTTAGYGQTALATVATGDAILASSWANLVNRTAMLPRIKEQASIVLLLRQPVV